MNLRDDSGEPILYNVNEEQVLRLLGEYFEGGKPKCNSENCQIDIAAISLNHTPSRYVVNPDHPQVYDVNDRIPTDDEVRTTIDKAAKIVGKRPHHGDR